MVVLKAALIGASAVAVGVTVYEVVKVCKAKKKFDNEQKELAKDIEEHNTMVYDYNENVDKMSMAEANAKKEYFDNREKELNERYEKSVRDYERTIYDSFDEMDASDDSYKDVETGVTILEVIAAVVCAATGGTVAGFGAFAFGKLVKKALFDFVGDYVFDSVMEKVIGGTK